MKILNKGEIPTPSDAWWVGQVVECLRCKFKAKLEHDDLDKVTLFADQVRDGINVTAHAEIVCPTCYGILWLYQPGKPVARRLTL